jgi:hypothetical protein
MWAAGIVVYPHVLVSMRGCQWHSSRASSYISPCTFASARDVGVEQALSYTPHVFVSARGCGSHMAAGVVIHPRIWEREGLLELHAGALSYNGAQPAWSLSGGGSLNPLRQLLVPGGWWLVVGDNNGESEPEHEDADDRLESASEKSELSWPAAGEDVADISSDSRLASKSSISGRSASEDGKKLWNRYSACISTHS